MRIETSQEDTDPEINLCETPEGRAALAMAYSLVDLIVFCESGLEKMTTFGKDAQDANAKIKEGDPLQSTSAMSAIWMHELVHIWSDPLGEPWLHYSIGLVSVIDDDLVPDQPLARQDDKGVITRVEGVNTYGFNECANLAKLVPDDAIDNADNYQLFATVSDDFHVNGILR